MLVNFWVLALMSASVSPVRSNSTAGSKRSRYFFKDSSQTVKPGTTAASVRSAMRARPPAVHAGMPKKSTNTPWGGVMLVSMRMPTVSPAFIAASKPRTNSSLSTARLPCMVRC